MRCSPSPARSGASHRYRDGRTFPTGTLLFGALLFGVIVIAVGLTYFPVVALGPVVEHLAGHF